MSEWRWLESTRRLQEEVYGKRFDVEGRPDDLADALMENYAAACVELGEFMQEVGWKSWAAPRGWVNRDAALGELVDAAHFVANLLVWLKVTDEEWERRYRAKQDVNRRRQASGYDGRSAKCPRCHRSYDDPGVACHPGDAATNVGTWCGRDHVLIYTNSIGSST